MCRHSCLEKKSHRCSNCGWELDEENFCGQCNIQFDHDGSVVAGGSDYMQSDAESHLEEEEEEDLEDFVVDNDQVEYEHLQDSILDDDQGSELCHIEVGSSTNNSDNSDSDVSNSEEEDDEEEEEGNSDYGCLVMPLTIEVVSSRIKTKSQKEKKNDKR